MSDATNTENTSSEITGCKIFFLYPTNSIINQIISELIQQEYEAYIAKDHTRLLRALKSYSDSIIYINLDEGMKDTEWEKWCDGLLKAIPTIRIGIIASGSEEEVEEKYKSRINVTFGYISLKNDMSRAYEKILSILDSSNIKGRRKYLRAFAERDSKATMNLAHNDTYINGSINDISVVGFSCVLETDPDLKRNSLCSNIQIKLQSTLIRIDAVVLGSRVANNEKMYVMIFTQRTDPETRIKIRKYIQQNIQTKMDSEIN